MFNQNKERKSMVDSKGSSMKKSKETLLRVSRDNVSSKRLLLNDVLDADIVSEYVKLINSKDDIGHTRIKISSAEFGNQKS